MESIPQTDAQIALTKEEANKVIHILIDECEPLHLAKIINVLYGSDNAKTFNDKVIVSHNVAAQALRAVVKKVK